MHTQVDELNVMELGSGDHRYEWIDEWATIPDTESGRENGRTHGVAVTSDGRVVVFNQADPAVLLFDRNGDLTDSWGSRFGGAHGLTLTGDNGGEHFWLTDQDSTEVVKTTLAGETVLTLDRPDHVAYEDGEYVPTWVAVNERRRGGASTVRTRFLSTTGETNRNCTSPTGATNASRCSTPPASSGGRSGQPSPARARSTRTTATSWSRSCTAE